MIVIEKRGLHLPMDEKKKLFEVQKKIKKNNHTALVFWISFRTDSARCNEKRRALLCSKNQIDRVLSRIFIHSHCKVRSHNPKGVCAGLNITTSQNSITENGNRLNSLY